MTKTESQNFLPEHLEDLQRSGLNKTTIEQLGIYSASPQDLLHLVGLKTPSGLESLLVFPYPGVNGYCRVKLFPTMKDKKGHSVKYLQRPKSESHLYVPNDTARVLGDPSIPLAWTEGEKKAARLDQEGQPTVGMGGLWNWLQEGKPIPDMDRIIHADRKEILFPDSNVWTKPELTKAVYAHGKELEQRGSQVLVAVVPGPPDGTSHGVDDYLIAEAGRRGKGFSSEEALAKLKLLPLKHATFSRAAEWWKEWQKEKKADVVKDKQGKVVVLTDPEPWDELVDGSQLLDVLTKTLKRFIILPPHAAETMALWILHAHALEAFQISPYLGIVSPVKRSGKTRLFDILRCLVPRPLPASNVTAAVLFRAVERFTPTLLCDEADTYLWKSDELRGVLNAGHARSSAWVLRNVGRDHEPHLFSIWAAKAIAMIGKLPDTLEDRSIVIHMKRKMSKEEIDRFRADRHSLETLRRQGHRWAQDNLEELRELDPPILKDLNDRASDNWRSLFAIAQLVGGEWPERARRAAKSLSGGVDEAESAPSIQLLSDLQDLFNKQEVDQLPTARILDHLHAREDRPWIEWIKGRPMTPRQMAKVLRGFGIRPKAMWVAVGEMGEKTTVQGYLKAECLDAFARYIPPDPQEPQDPSDGKDLGGNSDPQDRTSDPQEESGLEGEEPLVEETPNLADEKNSSNHDENNDLGDLVDEGAESAQEAARKSAFTDEDLATKWWLADKRAREKSNPLSEEDMLEEISEEELAAMYDLDGEWGLPKSDAKDMAMMEKHNRKRDARDRKAGRLPTRRESLEHYSTLDPRRSRRRRGFD